LKNYRPVGFSAVNYDHIKSQKYGKKSANLLPFFRKQHNLKLCVIETAFEENSFKE
jgi:hypothetical protein